jgi:hypothetical protein
MTRWAVHMAQLEEKRNAYSFICFTSQKSKSGNTAFGYRTSQNTTAKYNKAIQVITQHPTITHTKHNSQENN